MYNVWLCIKPQDMAGESNDVQDILKQEIIDVSWAVVFMPQFSMLINCTFSPRVW